MKNDFDVLVIGGGIVGCATAFYLNEHGLRPAIVERKPQFASLTTAASLQAVRAQFTDQANIDMMRESLDVYEQFADRVDDFVDIGLRQQGYLFVTTRDDGPMLTQARVELQHSLGLDDVDYMDGDTARAAWPYLSERVTAASFRARDGWLSARAAALGFARKAHARRLTNITVNTIRVIDGKLAGLETSEGFIRAPHIVLAAGPFSARLAATAGLDLPLHLGRRHHLVLNDCATIPANAPMTIDADYGAHWRPNDDAGASLAWSEADAPGEPLDPVPADAGFTRRVLAGVSRISPFYQQIAANLSDDGFTLLAGQYTITPDDKPLIGQSAIAGLWLNTGYSGHGVMGAPAGGRLLADLINGVARPDAAAFAPDRAGLDREPVGESMTL